VQPGAPGALGAPGAQPPPAGAQAQQAQQAGAGAQPPKQSGPITALFQAFDPSVLPPEAQRPPQPAPQPAQQPLAPSGLDIATTSPTISQPPPPPRVRQVSPPSTLPEPPPQRRRATAAQVAGSWVALVGGGLALVVGFTFFAWSTEVLSLDSALMPTFEKSFGVEPPRSSIRPPGPTDEELRKLATAAQERGDVPQAIVLWRRVKTRNPSDPLAQPALPKLRQELGEPPSEEP